MWPVILRELLTESRHPFTYWLRPLGAGMLLLAAAIFVFENGVPINQGGGLFAALHLTLFCSIWLLVPIVTADCISRERREGTLGLLFLTPLTPRNIVVAKALAQGLRTMALCIAALPVLAIPFLMGGVSWQEAVLSAATNFSSFCWAMAAGLLASSLSKVWVRSLALAVALSFLFAGIFAILNLLAWASAVFGFARLSRGYGGGFGVLSLEKAVLAATNIGGVWRELFARSGNAIQTAVLTGTFTSAAMALMSLLLLLQIAARNVRRFWQEEPPSARRLWVERTFCTPVLWVKFFRAWMQWKLDRNPIGWLEQRTWSARLVTWSWLAIVIALLSWAVGNLDYRGDGFSQMQNLLSWLLVVSMAMTAAGSFRRERENGVLELLLVSPLHEAQIILGRLRGIWGQFAGVILLVFATWIYLGSAFNNPDSMVPILFFAGTFATLPVVGLYYSLRNMNFVAAFLCTLSVAVVVPSIIAGVGLACWQLVVSPYGWGPSAPLEIVLGGGYFGIIVLLLQFVFARLLGSRLYQNLCRRRFTFQHGRA